MRESSSRAATAVALVAGLAVLVVAGQLLPTTPSAQRPVSPTSAGVTRGTVRMIPLQDIPSSTGRGVRVPNAIGHTLARATRVMHTAGLQGVATEHDPQPPTAVVVAQKPPAGELVPPRSVIGFRTRTDVQANGVLRQLRLAHGPTTATYRVVAPDPARHQLTVVVVLPPAVELRVWLETASNGHLPVLDTSSGTPPCHPTGGQSRCVFEFGRLDEEDPGVWTAKVAKHSSASAAIQVTVTFTR